MTTKDFNHDNKVSGFDHYVEHQLANKGSVGCCIFLILPIIVLITAIKTL